MGTIQIRLWRGEESLVTAAPPVVTPDVICLLSCRSSSLLDTDIITLVSTLQMASELANRPDDMRIQEIKCILDTSSHATHLFIVIDLLRCVHWSFMTAAAGPSL